MMALVLNHRTDVALPPDELDENVRPLVEALNRFPGIETVGSCGGHPNPEPYQCAEGNWYVKFDVEHSEAGWRSLEFIAWAKHDLVRGGKQMILDADSVPPYLNAPGATLKFALQGWGCDTVEIARWLNEWREELYIPAAEPGEEGLG